MSAQRIGVLGGSFDPIHNGHLRVAEIAQREGDLDRIIFVPTYQTRWKQMHASSTERLTMTQLAVLPYGRFDVSDTDIQRGSVTRTLDTLSSLHSAYPDDTLVFITGADALASFHSWHEWRQILELAELVGVARPGHTLDASAFDSEKVRQIVADTPDISSTACRARLRRGETLTGWVPDSVAHYIEARGLYG